MLMTEHLVGGFHIILPELGVELDIPPAARIWLASVFSLVTGSLLLPAGRLSGMYGSYVTFNFGLIWFSIWCLIAGFSKNYILLIVCRTLAGIGSSVFLVGGLMLLGKIYRPGPRKNLIFAMYGAITPIGFFAGIFFGGISLQSLSWRWYFWLGSIILASVAVTALLAIPK
ncbi:major facilitator superfamily domain-containing protein [Ilyonectria robusta]|uniref:major facilitator superfamily domain-containing protein n=1 Tax=Ilyonectria robusta TaxID=1079257 RepID=UPI001E8D1B95|nr:major facilitator superfamily domain-containing protein [Ilyonectria robusta]KAH8659014.1 major facilitator superfamily domain-containing protein [Ilyonectria robusta]